MIHDETTTEIEIPNYKLKQPSQSGVGPGKKKRRVDPHIIKTDTTLRGDIYTDVPRWLIRLLAVVLVALLSLLVL